MSAGAAASTTAKAPAATATASSLSASVATAQTQAEAEAEAEAAAAAGYVAACPLLVCNQPNNKLALTNRVYVAPKTPMSNCDYVCIERCDDTGTCDGLGESGVFRISEHELVTPGCIGLNSAQREFLGLLAAKVQANGALPKMELFVMVRQCILPKPVALSLKVNFEVVSGKDTPKKTILFKEEELSKSLSVILQQQILAVRQPFFIQYDDLFLRCRVLYIDSLASTKVTAAASTSATSTIANAHVKANIVGDGKTGVADNKKKPGARLAQAIPYGRVAPSTRFKITAVENQYHRIKLEVAQELFNPDFSFQEMGIGGLDEEFGVVFRRAFASRLFPPSEIAQLGIQHVKGMLLYGPPGTGKTLIARQIGAMLKGRKPKVVNGPEVLNRFVGASEENVRKLFAEAIEEQATEKAGGPRSSLHIIILDELDAICRARGSVTGSTGVHDTVVTQLLAMIDGVHALNNILVIGMTNRKDMIDEALLRPGRLEVHLPIGLPDEAGRLQILNIHTRTMRQHKKLASDVDLEALAHRAKNFSGAELEGLVKSAASFALYQHIQLDTEPAVAVAAADQKQTAAAAAAATDAKGNKSAISDTKNTATATKAPLAVATVEDVRVRVEAEGGVIVSMAHFERALKEIKPAFGGGSDDRLLRAAGARFWPDYSPSVVWILQTCRAWITKATGSLETCDSHAKDVSSSNRFQQPQQRPVHAAPLSILLHGDPGTGKTALAAKLAIDCGFPYSRLISADTLHNASDAYKVEVITKAFEGAYRSPLAVIVLDDLERLLSFSDLGMHYSNAMLQTLLVLIKRVPDYPECRLVVIATSGALPTLAKMKLNQAFGLVRLVTGIVAKAEAQMLIASFDPTTPDEQRRAIAEACPYPISVRSFLMLLGMARDTKTNDLSSILFKKALVEHNDTYPQLD